MSEQAKYLVNCWYVAALASEVDAGGLFQRRILGTSVLIYRLQSGQPVALQDRCPHRFAPLSRGIRHGDEVTCQYHGLRFDGGGRCVHSPHGDGSIPRAAQVRSFPLVERDGFLWIWPGNPALADPALIMDGAVLSRNPPASVAHTYMHNAVNYELLADNIMDLTHIDHLHGPLINTRGKLSPLIPKVSEESDGIRIRWDWQADPAMLLLATHLAEPESPARQFFEVKWHAPANMRLNVGAMQAGEDYHSDGVVLYDFHIMTPETDTTTHYFFASTRNYRMDDGGYNAAKMQGMIEAFTTEDKPLIEAQQQEMQSTDLWALQPVLLSSDAGAVRVRRRLRALIEAEQQVCAA
jgi:phenylpropionate dioxygenase-like ring-hydroxylating dioxygenase large terminal subunit